METEQVKHHILKTRVTQEVRDAFIQIATDKGHNTSDALRDAIDLYIKKQGQVDKIQDRFTEKVQALHTLTHIDIDDCRRAIIEAEGNGAMALDKIRDPEFINKTQHIPDLIKCTNTPEKIQYHFTKYGIKELSYHKGEIDILPEELILANNFDRPIAQPNYNGSHDCKLNYIQFICPRKPTHRELYDSLYEYIKSIVMLNQTDNYQLDAQIDNWFSPLIAAQEIEQVLYQLIVFLEIQPNIAEKICENYMYKIEDNYEKYR